MYSARKSKLKVKEKYISKQALPNEQIDAWVKWNKNAPYDKIILRYAKENRINHLLNISPKAFDYNRDRNSPGELIVKKEWVQVDGFVSISLQ